MKNVDIELDISLHHNMVHQTHCCPYTGCKYGEEDCPVVLGSVKHLYKCEDCYCREFNPTVDPDQWWRGLSESMKMQICIQNDLGETDGFGY